MLFVKVDPLGSWTLRNTSVICGYSWRMKYYSYEPIPFLNSGRLIPVTSAPRIELASEKLTPKLGNTRRLDEDREDRPDS